MSIYRLLVTIQSPLNKLIKMLRGVSPTGQEALTGNAVATGTRVKLVFLSAEADELTRHDMHD